MTVLSQATSSNHRLQARVVLGMAVIFIVVLAVLATMFLVAVISVG
jgi:hypothetical protein